jgi:hypothetical protein
MQRTLRELVALTGVSALTCAVAFVFDYVVATEVYATMACSIGVLVVVLTRRS